MIGSLQGKPLIIGNDQLLIDVSGVGYMVSVSPKLIQHITGLESIQLWIHTHVREENLDLFGFLKIEELQLFKILISISGIGPRTAIGIMNFDAGEIKKAILTGDVEFFTQVPRLGKKNAQKIIIELRSKLGSLDDTVLPGEEINDTYDVVEALVAMGFTKQDVRKALASLGDGFTTPEQRIRAALKHLGR